MKEWRYDGYEDAATIESVISEAPAMQEAAGREPALDPRGILDTLRAVKALGIDVTDTNRDWLSVTGRADAA